MVAPRQDIEAWGVSNQVSAPPDNPVEITLNSAEDSSNLTITEHLGQSNLNVQQDSLFNRNNVNSSMHVPLKIADRSNLSANNNPFIEPFPEIKP